MAHDSKIASSLLGITQAFRFFHNHRVDPAYQGKYFMRLPDDTRVPIEQYEARRKALRDAADREAEDVLRQMREEGL